MGFYDSERRPGYALIKVVSIGAYGHSSISPHAPANTEAFLFLL